MEAVYSANNLEKEYKQSRKYVNSRKKRGKKAIYNKFDKSKNFFLLKKKQKKKLKEKKNKEKNFFLIKSDKNVKKFKISPRRYLGCVSLVFFNWFRIIRLMFSSGSIQDIIDSVQLARMEEVRLLFCKKLWVNSFNLKIRLDKRIGKRLKNLVARSV